jgi:hypothetical protein
MKNNLILCFAFLLFAGCKQSHGTLSITKGQQIIDRATQLCDSIPDANSKKLIIDGLSQMIVVQSDKDGKASYSNQKQFALLIAPDAKLHKNKNTVTQKTAFQFDTETMQKTRHIVILVNEDLDSITQDLDAQACILIHEFIHALQENGRLTRGITNSVQYAYQDEQEAWSSQVYLYGKVHPEIFQYKCDCPNRRVETTLPLDNAVRNFILYNSCKDTFLETMYNRN